MSTTIPMTQETALVLLRSGQMEIADFVRLSRDHGWETPAIAVPGVQPATACNMPTPAPRNEAKLYAKIRALMVMAHCADKRPAHCCAGAITIARDTITLNCPRCGDVRKTLELAGANNG